MHAAFIGEIEPGLIVANFLIAGFCAEAAIEDMVPTLNGEARRLSHDDVLAGKLRIQDPEASQLRLGRHAQNHRGDGRAVAIGVDAKAIGSLDRACRGDFKGDVVQEPDIAQLRVADFHAGIYNGDLDAPATPSLDGSRRPSGRNPCRETLHGEESGSEAHLQEPQLR